VKVVKNDTTKTPALVYCIAANGDGLFFRPKTENRPAYNSAGQSIRIIDVEAGDTCEVTYDYLEKNFLHGISRMKIVAKGDHSHRDKVRGILDYVTTEDLMQELYNRIMKPKV
jgi:hypothetical protein